MRPAGGARTTSRIQGTADTRLPPRGACAGRRRSRCWSAPSPLDSQSAGGGLLPPQVPHESAGRGGGSARPATRQVPCSPAVGTCKRWSAPPFSPVWCPAKAGGISESGWQVRDPAAHADSRRSAGQEQQPTGSELDCNPHPRVTVCIQASSSSPSSSCALAGVTLYSENGKRMYGGYVLYKHRLVSEFRSDTDTASPRSSSSAPRDPPRPRPNPCTPRVPDVARNSAGRPCG